VVARRFLRRAERGWRKELQLRLQHGQFLLFRFVLFVFQFFFLFVVNYIVKRFVVAKIIPSSLPRP